MVHYRYFGGILSAPAPDGGWDGARGAIMYG